MLQKLKDNIKLEEIVERDRILKSFGKNYFTSCPFCGAKKGLCISKEKQFGHCFSCHETFDAFGYFQKVKGLTFVQSIIEIKKCINLNNQIEFQKLLKASLYFTDLRGGKNPISGEELKGEVFKDKSIMKTIIKIDEILAFLVSDYSTLCQEKYMSPEEVINCKQKIQQILATHFLEESMDNQKRLTNLFTYVLELLALIQKNDCNLSGIVYGLK